MSFYHPLSWIKGTTNERVLGERVFLQQPSILTPIIIVFINWTRYVLLQIFCCFFFHFSSPTSLLTYSLEPPWSTFKLVKAKLRFLFLSNILVRCKDSSLYVWCTSKPLLWFRLFAWILHTYRLPLYILKKDNIGN